ncbi:MAG: M20/M25/M40 family metallo-hydrolase, partial [Sutterellaceae bacterium]|nr:M20/M25/M40 family metallo-hydrolase [Sutterellaceae bacterium]
MKEELPPLDPVVERLAEDLMKVPAVKEGIAIALREADDAMKEEVEITEVPSTTFHEEVRAKEIARRMRLYGLTDVTIDEIGNVVGKRPGKGGGPVLALGAHMDTAFAEGTPVKVRREGNRYFGPGIGDNGSGLRALLQTIRCMNEAGIETGGDVWFVGTVGEEGNGDIRGSKFLFREGLASPIDGFIAVDNTDVGRILKGAIGAHRWRYTIKGPGGHSYASFGKVPSAVHAMCLAGARVARLRV